MCSDLNAMCYDYRYSLFRFFEFESLRANFLNIAYIYTPKIYRSSISKFKSLFPSIIQIFCIFILKKNDGYNHFKIVCKVYLLGSNIFSWFANQAYSDGWLSQTLNSTASLFLYDIIKLKILDSLIN